VELHQIAQHADDLDRATAFYIAHFGGQPIARFDPLGLSFLRIGAARLLLDQAAPSALIYLRVADVRTETDRLRAAGVSVETEAHLLHTDEAGLFGPAGWEEWMAFVRDSEGNLVGLASRHAPVI
jgi:methylmalonyl-CoA/ethylmalonyl-CoA epimerase